MLVEVNQTSQWSGHGIAGAREENRPCLHYCNCKTLADARAHPYAGIWFFAQGTSNHAETIVNGTPMCVCETTRDSWFLEIESLESFIRQHGRCVVEASDFIGIEFLVEIYDTYRE